MSVMTESMWELEQRRRAGERLTDIEQERLAGFLAEVQLFRADAERYNGYTNRETWAFNLHWQNDQGLYNMVLEQAREWVARFRIEGEHYNGELTNYGLGERVVNYVTEELPDLSPELWENMRSDVGSFWRIDYAEIGAAVRESLDAEGGDGN